MVKQGGRLKCPTGSAFPLQGLCLLIFICIVLYNLRKKINTHLVVYIKLKISYFVSNLIEFSLASETACLYQTPK